jgi:mono/diheme cytochrome c family protein
MKLNAIVVAAFAVLALTAATYGAVQAQDTKPGDPVNGKKVFLAMNCFECHSTSGQGGGEAGPKIAPNPPSPAAIMRQLRHPAGRMPAYVPQVLSDAQAADIIAYLQSIKPGKAAKDIPLLNIK